MSCTNTEEADPQKDGTEITLRQAQHMVDEWIRTVGVRYFNELTNMACLTEEVGELARIMAQYTGSINLHVVSLTHIQELLVKNCEEDYFTLILRRYMMTIADRLAHSLGCGGLVTGESRAGCVADHAGNRGDRPRNDPAGVPPVHRAG